MKKLKTVLFAAACLIGFSILSAAEFYNLRPFASGAMIALVLCGAPLYFVLPAYLIGEVVFGANVAMILGSASLAVCVCLARLLYMRLKKPLPFWAAALAAFIGKAGFTYALIIKSATPLFIILTLLFELLLALAFFTFFKPVVVHKLKFKLIETELVSGCVFASAIALGLLKIDFFGFTPAYLVCAAASLFALYASGTGSGIILALSFGCGFALKDFNLAIVATAVLPAAIAAIFIGGNKWLAAAGYVLGSVMTVYLFDYGGGLVVLSSGLGALVYACVPVKLVNKCKLYLNAGQTKLALRMMVNRTRLDIGNDLVRTGEIFLDMGTVMGSLMSENESPQRLALKLKALACDACEKQNGCRACRAEVLEEVVSNAIEKGRASISDLPEDMTLYCMSIPPLLSKVSQLMDGYKDKAVELKAEQKAVKIVSEQLYGASGVMRKLGERVARPVAYDFEGERKLIEELTYRGQVCSEALIAAKDDVKEITLILRKETYDDQQILKALYKLYRQAFMLMSRDDAALNGFIIAYFRSCPGLDLIFGVSQLALDGSGKCGDTHSFVKIGGAKFMLALSDGMGSGAGAYQVSEAAVSLAENYYKAGFSSEFILPSVNRFLSMRKQENFSAMDICVADLQSGSCDVIKIGTPATIIKRSETVSVIGGSSLPLGILDELKPYTVTVQLKPDDVIVLVSDGVSDAFEGDSLAGFINDTEGVNPQLMSRRILEKAVQNLGGTQKDDMSVICARVFLRL